MAQLFDDTVKGYEPSTADETIKKLERLGKYENSFQNYKDNMLIQRLAAYGDFEPNYNDTPEEAYLQEEKVSERKWLCNNINKALGLEESMVFWDFYRTQNESETALHFGYTIKKTHILLEKARFKIIQTCGGDAQRIRDCLMEEPVIRYAHKPIGMGMPYEESMEVQTDMRVQTQYGVRREKHKGLVCHMPEYLSLTGSDSICNLCDDKCTRKEVFPPQPKPTKEYMAKIDEIMKKCVERAAKDERFYDTTDGSDNSFSC